MIMQNVNIIIIEDDLKLKEQYETFFGENVKVFRDEFTFNNSIRDRNLMDGLGRDLPLVLIIDIMLAKDLDPNAQKAEPSPFDLTDDKEIDPNKYINYNQGLEIGKQIREGICTPLIDRNTPILFVTARRNETIINDIMQMTNSDYIIKPFAFEDIENKIISILNIK
jgi:DNA-binding NarL/FixJ family response regulator